MTGPGEKFDYLLKGMKAKGSRVQSPESIVETEESRVRNPEPIIQTVKADSREASRESRVESLDYRALEEAIEEANKKPKLGVYSPLAAAMLRYKAIKTPRYSMGSELRAVIEQSLKEAYPELYEEIQKRMKEGQS
jgi:hypothetical protein